MSKKHTKHAKTAKPAYGHFGRRELTILGTPCSEIKLLSHVITQGLSDFKTCYLDADHKGAQEETVTPSLHAGHAQEYVDKIGYHRFDQQVSPSVFEFKSKLNDVDLAVVNGNHFDGDNQILVIDSRKSMEKKLHNLTNVVLVLFNERNEQIPASVAAHIPGLDGIPRLHLDDTKSIVEFVQHWMKKGIAPLHGMVLAGGESQRMLRDKSQIDYHGKSQKEFMFDLLTACTSNTFISVRQAQQTDVRSIPDTFTGLGPYGAILSAFRQDPDAAWLVTACDQPFLSKATLDFLISHRNPSKTATAFFNPETGFPEPLISIWEPKAYPHLLYFLSQGYSCPRKVLINTDIEIVHLDDPSVLDNVNTPQEYELALSKLKS